MIQTRLASQDQKVKYSYGAYNRIKKDKQRIRITEGCPHNCPYCYEPTEIKIFDIPKIERNIVEISDMNLLCKKEAQSIIMKLGRIRVNSKVVYYELICGVDFRFLTQGIANSLKDNRFIRMRMAWDWTYKDVYKIKDALDKLVYAGYKPRNIQMFMIANWKITSKEYMMKLKTLLNWNIQVSDCWFDNQKKGKVEPRYWTKEEIKYVGDECRDHNIMCRHHGIQPEKAKS